jgi:hypothetical protein
MPKEPIRDEREEGDEGLLADDRAVYSIKRDAIHSAIVRDVENPPSPSDALVRMMRRPSKGERA